MLADYCRSTLRETDPNQYKRKSNFSTTERKVQICASKRKRKVSLCRSRATKYEKRSRGDHGNRNKNLVFLRLLTQK